jgi:hypothetical protein
VFEVYFPSCDDTCFDEYFLTALPCYRWWAVKASSAQVPQFTRRFENGNPQPPNLLFGAETEISKAICWRNMKTQMRRSFAQTTKKANDTNALNISNGEHCFQEVA